MDLESDALSIEPPRHPGHGREFQRWTRIGERSVTFSFAFEEWALEEASVLAGAQSSGRIPLVLKE